MTELTTTAAVVDALGGLDEVARLTGRKRGAAYNWPHQLNFPSNTYVVLTEALKERGYTAPASLWRMVPEVAQ